MQVSETESIIDHQSYAAGYRQAICDVIQPNAQILNPPQSDERPSMIPFVLVFLVMLAVFKFFGGLEQ